MVSINCSFRPYLGRWSNLTNIFQMGWNQKTRKAGILVKWLVPPCFSSPYSVISPKPTQRKSWFSPVALITTALFEQINGSPFWSQPKIQTKKRRFFLPSSGRRVHVFWEFGVQLWILVGQGTPDSGGGRRKIQAVWQKGWLFHAWCCWHFHSYWENIFMYIILSCFFLTDCTTW